MSFALDIIGHCEVGQERKEPKFMCIVRNEASTKENKTFVLGKVSQVAWDPKTHWNKTKISGRFCYTNACLPRVGTCVCLPHSYPQS